MELDSDKAEDKGAGVEAFMEEDTPKVLAQHEQPEGQQDQGRPGE